MTDAKSESEVARDEIISHLRELEQQAREYKMEAGDRGEEVNRANYLNLETAMGNLRLSLYPERETDE